MVDAELGNDRLCLRHEEGVVGSGTRGMGNAGSPRGLGTAGKAEPLHSREGMDSQGWGMGAAAGRDTIWMRRGPSKSGEKSQTLDMDEKWISKIKDNPKELIH